MFDNKEKKHPGSQYQILLFIDYNSNFEDS